MVPCKSAAEEVSFEWRHHRILSIGSKVRTTSHFSIIDSGSEGVKSSTLYLALNPKVITLTNHNSRKQSSEPNRA